MEPTRTRARRNAFLTAALLGAGLAPARVRAADYNGRVMLGVLRTDETLAEPSAGSDSNDRQALLARLFLDVTGVGSRKLQLTLDARDRYESFGKVDRERLVLVEENFPELRQLAVKAPPNGDLVTWAAGRFPVADAGVRGNDGAEVGMRLLPTTRLAAFGGFIPAGAGADTTRIDTKRTGRQAGVYLAHYDADRDGQRYLSASAALVARLVLEPLPLAELEEAAAAGEEAETEHIVARTGLHAQATWRPSTATRVSSLAGVDVAPDAAVRSLHLALDQRMSRPLRLAASLAHTDLSHAVQTRELLDALAPSAYSEGRVALTQTVAKPVAVVYEARHGIRGDGLSRSEGVLGLNLARVVSARIGAIVRAGYRKRFDGSETFARIGATYYGGMAEVAIGQELASRRLDDGEARQPSITDASVGVYLDRGLFASLTAEYARDEAATVASGLAAIGYKLQSGRRTPLRDEAPPAAVMEAAP